MIDLKSCHRCGGDLIRRDDQYGAYWQCLQCSFTSYISSGGKINSRVKATRYGSVVKSKGGDR